MNAIMPRRAARAHRPITCGRILFAFASVAVLIGIAADARAQGGRAAAHPDLAEAARALASGDTNRALELSTYLLKRNPGDAGAKVLLVRVHIDRGEWNLAYQVASRAVQAHPSNVDVLYYLGLAARQLAVGQFQRLAQMAPDSERVHQLRAETFEAQQRPADAEKEYAAALAVKPDLLEALLGLGRLERIRLACQEAISHFDMAEAIRPTFDGAYGLGVCHSYLKNEEHAVKKFELATKRSPSSGVAWTGLGTSLVRLGRIAEGIEKLQRAIALEPGMSEAHYMLGMAYQAAGDIARAQNAFKKAEELRSR